MAEDERVALYKIAVEESRFNVLLTWDRAKHFLVFNGVILGAAPALLKLNDSVEGQALVAGILLLGACHSAAGSHAVTVGHQYYREARGKVVLAEKALGLFDKPDYAGLAIATTPGKAEEIAKHTGMRVGPKRRLLGNITDQIRALLIMVAVVDLICFFLMVWRIVRHYWR